VIGCSAIEEDGTILDFDIREVRVTQAIIKNARSVVLVSDNSKFHRKAPVRLGNIDQIDCLVTDRAPPPSFMETCLRQHVEVVSVLQEQD
jgi:DeoR family glycerol-3-phosphate regulon repressor